MADRVLAVPRGDMPGSRPASGTPSRSVPFGSKEPRGFDCPLSTLVAEYPTVTSVRLDATLDEISEAFAKAGTPFVAVLDEDGKYMDCINVYDIVAQARRSMDLSDDEARNRELIADYGTTTADDLIGKYSLSSHNCDWVLDPAETIKSQILLFAVGQRYAIVAEKGNEIEGKVMEPVDIVRYAAMNREYIGADRMQTIRLDGFIDRKPRVVHSSMSAAQVLHDFYESKLSGLPIVDDDGNLLADFDPRAIIGLTTEHFMDLQLPIMQFLRVRKAMRPPVLLSDHCNLLDLIDAFASTGASRLYCVNHNGRLMGMYNVQRVLRHFREA